MNSKEAVNAAKAYIIDTFADEKVGDVGLEELEFDPDKDIWEITIGFSRPTYALSDPHLQKSGFLAQLQRRRSFKIVKIDKTGNIIALKSHPIESAHV